MHNNPVSGKYRCRLYIVDPWGNPGYGFTKLAANQDIPGRRAVSNGEQPGSNIGVNRYLLYSKSPIVPL